LTRGVSIDRAFNNWNLEKERARGKPESQIAVTGYPELYRELSLTWLRLSDLQKAFDAAVYARALAPTDPTIYLRMADILLAADRKEEAAVALVEGLMLTGDRNVMEALRNLYRSGLGPKGCAITQSANGPSLNAACESVHRHLCVAPADMMRAYLQMRRPEPAAHLKTTALIDYGCPAGPLNQVLPEGRCSRASANRRSARP
jgi:tetratricopeptide (TPR) repeat protein